MKLHLGKKSVKQNSGYYYCYSIIEKGKNIYIKRIDIIILKNVLKASIQEHVVYVSAVTHETQFRNSIFRLFTISFNNLHNNGLNY